MNLSALSDPLPLVLAEDGRVIRVAGSRVTLDTLVGIFKSGATPEEIAQAYSAVSLADVYAVITYYLRHRSEVEKYLERRTQEHAELRREIEGRPEYQGTTRAAPRPNEEGAVWRGLTLRLAVDENFDGRIPIVGSGLSLLERA